MKNMIISTPLPPNDVARVKIVVISFRNIAKKEYYFCGKFDPKHFSFSNLFREDN